MTPEALDALVASGATVEMIAAAWKAEMVSEPRRSGSAERMARKRARDAASRDTCDVTCDASDVTVTESVTPLPPSLSSPQPPQQTHPPAPVKENTRASASARGSRLAPDFELPDDWRDWAMRERGWERADAEEEGRAFADFWHGKPGRDGCKADWPATWRNWTRNSRRKPGSVVADRSEKPRVPL